MKVEDTNEVLEIDSKGLTVTKRYAIAPGEEPAGMAMDIAHHRIFSGSEINF